MAPTKRKAEQAEAVAVPAMTRSSAWRAAVSNSADSLEKVDKKKAEKKAKVESEEIRAQENGEKEKALEAVDGETKKTVIIEHWKKTEMNRETHADRQTVLIGWDGQYGWDDQY
ncbi:hypothetical protein TIFTF001_009035 [Ficus carica]|uniref:Uncharacterized protein n=1 Tax=Ficus carica TaxID=3494 RepID=A0AA88DHB0_FICCA|nr:hypothetical protein TIFTF001_009035 [Ficus carica]